MRCAMAKGIAGLVLAYGLTWLLLVTDWVLVGEASLTGAELNQTLTLLPAISMLTALIALYRKFPRFLLIASGLIMGVAGYLGFTLDFEEVPASLALQESMTGIAGGSALAEVTVFPTVFSIAAIACSLLAIAVSTMRFSTRPRVDEVSSADDVRGIWDEQS